MFVTKRTDRLNSTKRIEYVLIAVGICLICFFVLRNLNSLNSITVLDDEFGYWGIANYIKGNNWSEILGTVPYYGFGSAWLYALILSLVETSSTAYKIAIIFNCLFLVVSYFISIYLFKKKYPNINGYIIVIFAIFTSLYPNTIVQSQIGWVESMLYCWFWISLLLLYKIEDSTKKMPYVTIFSIWTVFGVMIHMRTIGIVASALLIFVVYRLNDKISKSDMAIGIFVIIFVIIAFIFIKESVTGNIYNSSTILNSFSKVSTTNYNEFSGQIGKILSVFSINGFISLLLSIFGKLYYLILSTFFLILFFLSRSTIALLNSIRNKFVETDNLSIFVLVSFVSTLLISSVFMINLGDRGDTFLYGRYVELLIGPVLMYSLTYVYEKHPTYKSSLGIIILTTFCTKVIVKVFEYAGFTTFHVTNIAGVSAYFLDASHYFTSPYDLIVKYILIGSIVVYIINNKKVKESVIIGSLSIIFLFVWLPNIEAANSVTYQVQENISQDIASTVEYLEGDESDIKYLVDDSTFENAFNGLSDRNLKYLQFALGNQEIIPVTDESINKNDLLIVKNGSSEYDAINDNKAFTLKDTGEYFSVFLRK